VVDKHGLIFETYPAVAIYIWTTKILKN